MKRITTKECEREEPKKEITLSKAMEMADKNQNVLLKNRNS